VHIKSDPKVAGVFDNYPVHVKERLLFLRDLIINAASEIDGLNYLEETLKWGEPSYLTKFGSTVRMDWKEKTPEQFAIYFKCTSMLVPTFKILYNGLFTFERKRAIVFNLEDKIPVKELKQCISLALTYHKVKHLPLLGG
jgi:hypothetical protein